jgi:hypothetical protein
LARITRDYAINETPYQALSLYTAGQTHQICFRRRRLKTSGYEIQAC